MVEDGGEMTSTTNYRSNSPFAHYNDCTSPDSSENTTKSLRIKFYSYISPSWKWKKKFDNSPRVKFRYAVVWQRENKVENNFNPTQISKLYIGWLSQLRVFINRYRDHLRPNSSARTRRFRVPSTTVDYRWCLFSFFHSLVARSKLFVAKITTGPYFNDDWLLLLLVSSSSKRDRLRETISFIFRVTRRWH